jgi:hypothetical protein
MPMSSASRFERKQLVKTSLCTFALVLSLLHASARAEEAARGDGVGAVIQPSNQAQKEKPRSENPEEEFKIRYKRPKQRHDDDEAPVPKFGKPSQPDSAASGSPEFRLQDRN